MKCSRVFTFWSIICRFKNKLSEDSLIIGSPGKLYFSSLEQRTSSFNGNNAQKNSIFRFSVLFLFFWSLFFRNRETGLKKAYYFKILKFYFTSCVVVAHTSNPCTWEAEACRSLRVQGHWSIRASFQERLQSYKEILSRKAKNKKKNCLRYKKMFPW